MDDRLEGIAGVQYGVIKSVVGALSDLIRKQKIVLETPMANFEHLSALYSGVDLNGLWEYTKNIVDRSKKEYTPKRSRNAVRHRNLSDRDLLNLSYQVIIWLANEYDNYDPLSSLPRGKSWSQLIKKAKECSLRLNLEQEAAAIAPDRLIDGGLVVTEISEVSNSKGEPFAIRTFIPDSEIVLKKILRQSSVKGEQCIIVT